jgi:hypothetical protein
MPMMKDLQGTLPQMANEDRSGPP